MTNNGLQTITHTTEDRATRTPLITGGERMCSGRVDISCSTCVTCSGTIVKNTVISHE